MDIGTLYIGKGEMAYVKDGGESRWIPAEHAESVAGDITERKVKCWGEFRGPGYPFGHDPTVADDLNELEEELKLRYVHNKQYQEQIEDEIQYAKKRMEDQ